MSNRSVPKFGSIMIIDDNQIDRYIMARLILKQNIGEKVYEYSSAKEALLFLEANQENPNALPDLIFVDIHMPVMNGFEFMEAYDHFSATLKKRCMAYIFSSTIHAFDIERAKGDKNVVDFKEKPLTKAFLQEIKAA